MEDLGFHRSRGKRSTFLHHPLCRELNIGISSTTVAAGPPGKKRRSLERRCAMDLVTTNPSVVDFDVCENPTSSTEHARDDAYHKNGLPRPAFRTIHPIDAGTISAQFRSNAPGSYQEFENERNTSCRSSSSNFHHSNGENSLLPPLTVIGTTTSAPRRGVRNHCDHFDKGASSSPDKPPQLLPPSVRKLLSSLGNSESLFTTLILGGEETPTDSATTTNILLDEMRRMEDQNIWNKFREREYK